MQHKALNDLPPLDLSNSSTHSSSLELYSSNTSSVVVTVVDHYPEFIVVTVVYTQCMISYIKCIIVVVTVVTVVVRGAPEGLVELLGITS